MSDLNLHIAAMLERMEFENTLPNQEKSRRRLIRLIGNLEHVTRTAAETGYPDLWIGHLERIFHHMEVVFGETWREDVCRRRSDFFGDQR